MGFVKHASVQSLGTATFAQEGLQKIARSAATEQTSVAPAMLPKSYYVDGARKIDVRGMLKKASAKFNISDNPAHYIFEAIRANTVTIPNENHDAFHKNELLRFDTRLAMPVYLTYIGKPHHLNHKTDDPLRARGVILDSHYNDDAPALENCPTCNYRTASEDGRDASGIMCVKCGTCVKDEFIEILVAVDGNKDPRLVREIQAGALNAGSMGCNCASTSCNVCNHVARSVNEFCEHIRGSSKGSLWLREGSKFVRTSADKVKSMLRSANLKCAFEGNSLVAVSLSIPERDFEVRKAFEFCQGVEFDEYSRVHRPADPKARTVEILKAAEDYNFPMTLDQETEQLIRRARLAELEASVTTLPKAASASQFFHVARVNGDDEHIQVSQTFEGLSKILRINASDRVEYAQVEADSVGQAIVRATKSAQYLPMQSEVNLVVPDGVRVQLDQSGNPQMMPNGPDGEPGGQPGAPGMPGQPGQMPGGPQSIENVTQQEMAPSEPQQSPEEFGMLPPGASLETSAEGGAQANPQSQQAPGGESEEQMKQEPKYAAVYGDFEVEVFEDKATLFAPGGEIFNVRAEKKLESNEDKRQFGGALIDSVLADGLVRTALKFKGEFSKRLADSTEGAMFDMAGGRPMSSGGALEGAMQPQREVYQEGSNVPKAPGATQDYDDDMQASRPMPTNSIESRDTDMKDEAATASPKQNATEGHEEPQREKRPNYSQTDDALSGGTTDMKANAGGDPSPKIASATAQEERELERTKKLYASRMERKQAELDAAKAEWETEKKTLVKAEQEKIFRALRIAQRRAALNIEVSPLKAKVLDSLTVARPIGRSAATGEEMEYAGLDEGLALHLVEAAWQDSSAEEVETLIQRAAELLEYDTRYLISAEKDLSKQAAVVPPVFDEGQLEPINEIQRRSASLRAAAVNGNMTLAPGQTDSGVGEDKADLIRSALAPTRVSRLLPEEFRPSF